VNGRQVAQLRRLIEDGHPDASITVTPCDGGAVIAISEAKTNPGLSGPGDRGTVRLKLGDDSPFLLFLLARRGLK
jgi:hypothetical protein